MFFDIFPFWHDNVIDLMMKITGKIILKTTFRCPRDTIVVLYGHFTPLYCVPLAFRVRSLY